MRFAKLANFSEMRGRGIREIRGGWFGQVRDGQKACQQSSESHRGQHLPPALPMVLLLPLDQLLFARWLGTMVENATATN